MTLATLVQVLLGYAALSLVAGVTLAILHVRRSLRERLAIAVADEARRGSKAWSPGLSIAVLPGVSDEGVVETVAALRTLDLPSLEIIVVGDSIGRANLFSVLARAFGCEKSLRVFRHEIRTAPVRAVWTSKRDARLILIDKPETGAADVLNTACNIASHPIFGWISSGVRLDAAVVRHMLENFRGAPERLGAVGAPSRPACGGLSNAIHWNARLETAIPAATGWLAIAGAGTTAGGFILYRKRVLETAGGFRPATRSVRLDSALRISDKLRDYRAQADIVWLSEPAAWEAPASTLTWIAHHQSALLEVLNRYGWRCVAQGPGPARLATLHLAFFEALRPFIETAILALLPSLAAAGLLDVPIAVAGVALVLGGAALRIGIASLAEIGNRERFGNDVAARRFLGALLAPILHIPVILARAFAFLNNVRAVGEPVAGLLSPAPLMRALPALAAPAPAAATPTPPPSPAVVNPTAPAATATPPVTWPPALQTDNSTPQEAIERPEDEPKREPWESRDE